MEIKINYQGKVRTVTITESEKDPVNVIYDCEVEGIGKIELITNSGGKWVQLVNNYQKESPLAELIRKEKERVDKVAETEDTFSLQVEYKGKNYDLRVTPEFRAYRVVQAGHFLMSVWPPGEGEHQWHPGYGNDADKHFAAVIGIAIENR